MSQRVIECPAISGEFPTVPDSFRSVDSITKRSQYGYIITVYYGYRQLAVVDRELSKRLFRPSGGKSLPYSSMTLLRTFGGPIKCMSYDSMLNSVP